MELIQTLKAQPVALTEFDESLWNLLAQSVIVYKKAYLEVIFRTSQTEKWRNACRVGDNLPEMVGENLPVFLSIA